MMAELGLSPSPAVIADHYSDFLDAVFVDEVDAALADRRFIVARTLMRTREDRVELARVILERMGAGLGQRLHG